MPSVYDLKPAFQGLLRPVLRRMASMGVTANQVTLSALLMSFATGAVIAWRPVPRALLLLPGVLFLRMALNAMDGMLAREFNQKSRLGAILNELGDVVSDTAIYLPLALVPGFPIWLVFGIVLLAALSEMTGVLGLMIGASRRYDGPMGKSDRAFVFGALGLGLGFGVKAGVWLTWLLAFVLVLLLVTIFNRARRALKENP
ncbi:MAG: CDP-alcohol phosphatidyltransferase family protein [Holophagaceae bacterium]|nr:CDP-alcohol phosphatidyltransferase family protein [Holophagaceae bacterium]